MSQPPQPPESWGAPGQDPTREPSPAYSPPQQAAPEPPTNPMPAAPGTYPPPTPPPGFAPPDTPSAPAPPAPSASPYESPSAAPYEAPTAPVPQPPAPAPQPPAPVPQPPPAPGYQAPAPGYQAPAAGYQAPPAYPSAGPQPVQTAWPPQPAQNTSINGFAVASLILGICGGILLSLIFGIVALVQIKNKGGRGKGMAVAGIVLSVIWLLVAVAAFAAALVRGTASAGGTGAVTAPATVAPLPTEPSGSGERLVLLDDLQPGDCITDLVEDELRFDLPVVPCSEPHMAEVVAIEALLGTDYPGDDAVAEESGNLCYDALVGYAPSVADEFEVFFFPPSQLGWTAGDREVICLAYSPDEELTASIAE